MPVTAVATGTDPSGTASGASVIRNVVKLYKARTQMCPNLRLNKSTEEASIRLMDRSKFAEASVFMLGRIVSKGGWSAGPLSQDSILALALVIGASLVETSNVAWGEFAVQTAAGQRATFTMIEAMLTREQAVGCPVTRHSRESVQKFAVVAGLWQQLMSKTLPALLPPHLLKTMEHKFQEPATLNGSWFDEVWALAHVEADDDMTDAASIATFVQKHVGELRRLQAWPWAGEPAGERACVGRASKVRKSHSSSLWQATEAASAIFLQMLVRSGRPA